MDAKKAWRFKCVSVGAALGLALLIGVGCGTQTPVPSSPSPPPEAPPSERTISAQNVASLQELRQFPAAIGPVLASAFEPNSHTLATLGWDRVVRLWDADSGRLLAELYEHNGPGRGLAYSPDGSRLISSGRSSGDDILIWNTANSQATSGVNLTGYVVYDVDWSPDGSRFAVVSRGSSRVFIYQVDGLSLTQRRPSGQWLWSVAYGTDWLAVTSETGATYVYTTEGYDFRKELPHPARYPGRDLQFSPDESLLANCFVDGTVVIWRTTDWELVTSIQAHAFDEVASIEGCRNGTFSRSGDVYFSVGDDGRLAAWDPYTGAMLFEIALGERALAVSISSDGELLAVALRDGTIHIFGLPEVARQ